MADRPYCANCVAPQPTWLRSILERDDAGRGHRTNHVETVRRNQIGEHGVAFLVGVIGAVNLLKDCCGRLDEIGRVAVEKQELLRHRIGIERLAFRVHRGRSRRTFKHPDGSIRWNAE